MTPAVKIGVHQLLHCDYQGITRYLYVEGKALELIALKLERMANQPDINKHYRPLKPQDVERIYQCQRNFTLQS